MSCQDDNIQALFQTTLRALTVKKLKISELLNLRLYFYEGDLLNSPLRLPSDEHKQHFVFYAAAACNRSKSCNFSLFSEKRRRRMKEQRKISEFAVSVINGEKAAFNTPTFAQKRERTLDMLLRNLYREHMSDACKVALKITFVMSHLPQRLASFSCDFPFTIGKEVDFC